MPTTRSTKTVHRTHRVPVRVRDGNTIRTVRVPVKTTTRTTTIRVR